MTMNDLINMSEEYDAILIRMSEIVNAESGMESEELKEYDTLRDRLKELDRLMGQCNV